MSVILEALQKANTGDADRTGSITRGVDVRPTSKLKLKPESPVRLIALIGSFVIVLIVGAAGAAAFYWVIEHRAQFTFGFNPTPVTAAAPGSDAKPTQASPANAADTQPKPATSPGADLPPPVPLQVAAAAPAAAALPAVPVSTQALPPPPVGQAASQSGQPPVANAAASAPSPAAPANPFVLGTILCGEANDCSAMINGRTLHRGEMIKDHRVTEITSTQVKLQRGVEEPITLSLFR
jgi:cytoskeletal protein RodZ